MKTTSIFIIALLMSYAFINISCQKNVDTIPPETIDSVKSILPKQIIWNDKTLETTIILSIKYDTANYRIEIYEDDTTNSNPYDKLVMTSTFNKDGYLQSFDMNTSKLPYSNFANVSVKINRGLENKISYLAYDDKDDNTLDTSFYTYEYLSGGMNIRLENSNNYFGDSQIVYHYDTYNKLLDYHSDFEYGKSVTFSYNPSGSINDKTNIYGSSFMNQFLYTSGLPDEKEDLLNSLLMGKDCYLKELKALCPLNLELDYKFDFYRVSPTDPYHATHMTALDPLSGDSTIEEASLSYKINDRKLLSKVTFINDGDLDTIVTFKY